MNERCGTVQKKSVCLFYMYSRMCMCFMRSRRRDMGGERGRARERGRAGEKEGENG